MACSANSDRLLEAFPNAEPKEIITFVYHDGQQLALVRWTDIGQAYVPYSFVRKHLQKLLIKYMKANHRYRYCPKQYFEDGLAGRALPDDSEIEADRKSHPPN